MLLEDQFLKKVSLALLAVLIILTVLFFYYEFAHHPTLLRRKLRELEKVLAHESLDYLKKKYLEVYGLYLKLAEKKKEFFYSRIMAVREMVEAQMKRKNQVEDLIAMAEKATMAELKPIYAEFEKAFQQLTTKAQQQNYPKYSYLKERVRKGN